MNDSEFLGGGPQSEANRDRLPLWVIFAAIGCCAIWGGNAVAIKRSVPALPAFGCAGLRFLISLPILYAICRVLKQPAWVPSRRLGLLMIHVLFTVVQIGSFNVGTSLGQAGRSSIFINIHPLIVAPLSWLFLGERLGFRAWLGLFSASCGVGVLIVSKSSNGGPLFGDAIVIFSGIVFGIQTVAQKKSFPWIPPATLLFTQTLVSAPIFLVWSVLFEGGPSRFQFTTSSTAGVFYQGVIVSGVCFSAWMLLLRRFPAGKLAALAFVTPLFGVAFGILIEHERLTLPLVFGGLLVGLGIRLVSIDRPLDRLDVNSLALPGEDAP